MKKLLSSVAVLVLSWMILGNRVVTASADWWSRPEARPTQPSIERNLPTSAPSPTEQINPPSQPSATPRVGGDSPTPTTAPSTGDSGSSNPCDPGKSFAGPYCGWSPDTTSSGVGGGVAPRIGSGPQVLGLSNTSSSDVYLSDIMILAGILCLAIYARSKIATDNQSL